MKPFLIFSSVLVLTLAGCSPSKVTFGNTERWLPPDFDPRTGVLMIERVYFPKTQQRKIEEYMTTAFGFDRLVQNPSR